MPAQTYINSNLYKTLQEYHAVELIIGLDHNHNLDERSQMYTVLAGTVEYLRSVGHETPNSEHRLMSSPELHSHRQPVVVST